MLLIGFLVNTLFYDDSIIYQSVIFLGTTIANGWSITVAWIALFLFGRWRLRATLPEWIARTFGVCWMIVGWLFLVFFPSHAIGL